MSNYEHKFVSSNKNFTWYDESSALKNKVLEHYVLPLYKGFEVHVLNNADTENNPENLKWFFSLEKDNYIINTSISVKKGPYNNHREEAVKWVDREIDRFQGLIKECRSALSKNIDKKSIACIKNPRRKLKGIDY